MPGRQRAGATAALLPSESGDEYKRANLAAGWARVKLPQAPADTRVNNIGPANSRGQFSSYSGDQISMEDIPANPRAVSLLALALEGVLAAVALALGWLLGINPLELARPDWAAVGWGAAWGFGLAVVLLGASEFPWGPLATLRRLVQERLVPLFRGCRWWHVALVSAAAGIAEELAFRGVLQVKAAQWLGPAGAVAVASALFGLAHCLSLAYFLVASLMGVVFGWLLVAHENLLVPIVAHSTYDFAAILYLLRRTGPAELPTDEPPRGGPS